jgi:hypothetical protein
MKDKTEKTIVIDSEFDISPYGDRAEERKAERDRVLEANAKVFEEMDPKP